ncbi:MAG TPA: hypothetical protein VFQ67_01565 [Allosphingosinicella sp.]|jgi:hypothetical protein|nr:hypothetical protein [Allosphingosinicella sp.]
MARVYLFNMISGNQYGTSLSIIVNGATPAYAIQNTYPSINFVPFSSSGALVGGGQPKGNAFIDSNRILAKDSLGNLSALFEAVLTPGQFGDLVAFISQMDIAVYASSGVFLAAYPASGNAEAAQGAEDAPFEPAASLATTPGKVFIFNLFSQDITVSSNGGIIGKIPAWSDGSGSVSIYTPSVLVAQRTPNQSDGPGKIANGTNRLQVSRLEQPGRFDFTVDPNPFPTNQNLLLFIALDHWRLVTQFGQIVDEGPINPLTTRQDECRSATQKEDEMEDVNSAYGNVYVFNVTSQDLSLSTNGASTGAAILGWSQSGTTKYQPNVQAVPRVLNSSEGGGKFFNGKNQLTLTFLDGLFIAQVPIDGSTYPLNQDLLLLIERNKWQLVTQYAVEMLDGEVMEAGFLREALDSVMAEG